MCALLNLTRSGFYAWQRHRRGIRSIENEILLQEIKRIYEEGKGEYGSPTIYEALRQEGHLVNHKRISGLMRKNGIRSKLGRRFVRTTKPCKDRDASPNLLQQNFHTDMPNTVWLSDITFIDSCPGSVADGLGTAIGVARPDLPLGPRKAIRGEPCAGSDGEV
jgi:transposase InsO family protein